MVNGWWVVLFVPGFFLRGSFFLFSFGGYVFPKKNKTRCWHTILQGSVRWTFMMVFEIIPVMASLVSEFQLERHKTRHASKTQQGNVAGFAR